MGHSVYNLPVSSSHTPLPMLLITAENMTAEISDKSKWKRRLVSPQYQSDEQYSKPIDNVTESTAWHNTHTWIIHTPRDVKNCYQ